MLDDWTQIPENIAQLSSPAWPPPEVRLPSEILDLIAPTITEMRQAMEACCSRMLPSYERLTASMSTKKILNLATSLFWDKASPYSPIRGLPYHLLHRRSSAAVHAGGLLTEALSEVWVYDDVSASIVRTILSLCALDLGTCTHAQLDEADPYVVCLNCPPQSAMPTMKWEQAVSSLRVRVDPTTHLLSLNLHMCSTFIGAMRIMIWISRLPRGEYSTTLRSLPFNPTGSVGTPLRRK